VRADDERGSPPFVFALGGNWRAEYDFDVANRSAFSFAFLYPLKDLATENLLFE
jgi:hypothetical protein